MNNKLRFSKDLIIRHYDKIDTTIIYNSISKKFYILKGVAAFICKKLEENQSDASQIEAIKKSIQKHFNCPKTSIVKNDITSTIDYLKQAQLLKTSSSENTSIKKTALKSSTPSEKPDKNLCYVDATLEHIIKITELARIPFTATFEITSQCQLDCIHCYYPEKVKTKWNIKNFSQILDELKNLGTMEIGFTGGECFLHPNIDKFLKLTKEKNFIIHILTNGALITKEKAEFIASIHPKSIQLSLYGSNATVHDSITQKKGSFEKTLRAIDYLKEAGIKPNIACTVMKNNYHDIENLSRWCAKKDLSCSFNFKILPSYHPGKDPQKLSCLHKECALKMLSKKAFNPALEEIKFKNSSNKSQEQYKWAIKPKKSKRICPGGFNRLCLTPNGTVIPCSILRLNMGNVFQDNLKSIWYESPVLKKWRKITIDQYPKCQNCEALPMCETCPAGHFIITGNTNIIDEDTCFLGKTNYAIVKKILKQKNILKG